MLTFNMKMKALSLFLAIATAGVISASATPINLGQATGSPADDGSILVRLNSAITAYNLVNTPHLPTAILSGALDGSANGVTSVAVNITGWAYIALKWADTDQFYYVGGSTGTLTFNSTVFNGNGQPQALSGYTLFNPGTPSTTPDAASTMLLLGSTITGLSMIARRFKK
jgi:hypothetical protein